MVTTVMPGMHHALVSKDETPVAASDPRLRMAQNPTAIMGILAGFLLLSLGLARGAGGAAGGLGFGDRHLLHIVVGRIAAWRVVLVRDADGSGRGGLSRNCRRDDSRRLSCASWLVGVRRLIVVEPGVPGGPVVVRVTCA